MKEVKKYIIYIGIILISFSCIGCSNSKEVVSEEAKVEQDVEILKSPREEIEFLEGIANGVFVSDDIFDGIYDEIENYKDENGKLIKKSEVDIMRYIFNGCEVTTLEESIDDNNKKATVNGEYKMPDIGKVIKAVLDEKKFINKKDWEQVYYDEIIKKLKDEKCEKISVKITYNLELKENKWIVIGDNDFQGEMNKRLEESLKANIPDYK